MARPDSPTPSARPPPTGAVWTSPLHRTGKKEGQRRGPCRCQLPTRSRVLVTGSLNLHHPVKGHYPLPLMKKPRPREDLYPHRRDRGGVHTQVCLTSGEKNPLFQAGHMGRHAHLKAQPPPQPSNTHGGSVKAPKTQPASGSLDRKLPLPRALWNEAHFSFQQIFIEHLVKAPLGI